MITFSGSGKSYLGARASAQGQAGCKFFPASLMGLFITSTIFLIPGFLFGQTHEIVVRNPYVVTYIRESTYQFSKHTVDGSFDGARSVYAADLDGDGDIDICGMAYEADDVTWWENADGSGTNWIEHTVDGNFDGASSIFAADVDGDGDLDVLGAASGAEEIAWWENVGGSGTNWIKHTVAGSLDGARSVHAADVDGDGDMDVLGVAAYDNDIFWWENADGGGTNWIEHEVDGNFARATSVYAADVDGDADMDVLGAAQSDRDIAWWENTDGDGKNWVEHTVDGDFFWASSVYVGDVDGDGDRDVLGAAQIDDEIAWWENTDGTGTNWMKHVVDGAFDAAYSVYAADVDGDGDLDVLGAARIADDITWWENADGSGTNWAEHTLDGAFNDANSVYAADVDGDGDLDILGAAGLADDIVWWSNDSPIRAVFSPPIDTNVIESSTRLIAYLTNAIVSVNSFTQIVCTGWVRMGSDPDTGPGCNTGFFVLTNDAAINFNWRTQYWLSVTGDAHGSVDTEDGWRFNGSNVTISAMPDPLAYFSHWSGDLSPGNTNDNPLTLNMNRARMLKATFVLPEYEVIVSNAYTMSYLRESGLGFTKHPVDAPVERVDTIHVVDLDGDGDMDVIGGIGLLDDVAWWENVDGTGTNWVARILDDFFHGPAFVYADDVDGDGDMDVLAAARYADDIAWWENTDGEATNWIKHFVDGDVDLAQFVQTADMDDDGDIDVIGAGGGGGTLAWWENVGGDGTNWMKHDVGEINAGVRSVRAVDVDGDGHLDVVAGAHISHPVVSWWQNLDGSGTNWIEHRVAAGFSRPPIIHSGDVDGDGDMDIVGNVRFGGNVYWWENSGGNGLTWNQHQINLTFGDAYSIHVADLDHDGDVDVLGTGDGVADLTWWENLGGSPLTWSRHDIEDRFESVADVFAADIDGDGSLDVVGATSEPDRLLWWESDFTQALSFIPPAWTNQVSASTNVVVYLTNSVAWGNDATQLVCTGWIRTGSEPGAGGDWNTGVFVFSNDTVLTFNWQTQFWLTITVEGLGNVDQMNGWKHSNSNVVITATPEPLWIFAGWSGDVPALSTNDNPLTLALDRARDIKANFLFPEFELIVHNQHTRTYVKETRSKFTMHTLDANFTVAEAIHTADIDADGATDVLGAARSDNEIALWRNADGTGTNWIKLILNGDYHTANSVSTADMDGDSDLDVLGSAFWDEVVTWWENTDGSGSNWVEHEIKRLKPWDARAADVDGDGDNDVIVARDNPNELSWFENRNSNFPNWIEHTIESRYPHAISVRAADMDNDGDVDVLAATILPYDIAWWENVNGSGTNWARHLIEEEFIIVGSAEAADMDGDGDLDVLSATENGNVVRWWENTCGTGIRWNEHTVDGNVNARNVFPADIDGDGDMDIAGGEASADTVIWWENTEGLGRVWREHVVETNFDIPIDVRVADIDGDGEMDLVASSHSSGIAWWEGDSELRATFDAPLSTNVLDVSTNLVAYLTNAVAWRNSWTQLACTGWVRTGSDPASGSGHETGVFGFTNHAVITFNWSTQFWLSAKAGPYGRVDDYGGWRDSGVDVSISAIPDPNAVFSAWSGDVPAGATNDNPLVVPMDGSRWVNVAFERRKLSGPPCVGFAVDSIAERFVLATNLLLGGPNQGDMSGCAHLTSTDELLVVQDATAGPHPTIQVYDLEGNYRNRVIVLRGFNDTEGICQFDPENDLYAIVEERIAHITIVEITGSTTNILKGDGQTHDMGFTPGNDGIEGITYDPASYSFFGVKQKDPLGVYRVDVAGGVTVTSEMFNAESAVGHLMTSLSDLTHEPVLGHLFLLEQDRRRLVECDLAGNVKAMRFLTFANFFDPDGITFNPQRREMYLVGEPNHFAMLTLSPIVRSFSEGSTVELDVCLSGPWTNPASVGFVITSDTAVAGQDFSPSAGRIQFQPGTMSTTLVLNLLADFYGEGDETLQIQLSDPTNACLGIDHVLEVTIEANPDTTLPMGTPVPWMIDHGLTNSEFTVEELLDVDGDGMFAWQEYAADTDPTNSDSVLAVTSIWARVDGFAIWWKGGRQAWQFLERMDTLDWSSGVWHVIWTNMPPTSFATGIIDRGANSTSSYYRIKALR